MGEQRRKGLALGPNRRKIVIKFSINNVRYVPSEVLTWDQEDDLSYDVRLARDLAKQAGGQTRVEGGGVPVDSDVKDVDTESLLDELEAAGYVLTLAFSQKRKNQHYEPGRPGSEEWYYVVVFTFYLREWAEVRDEVVAETWKQALRRMLRDSYWYLQVLWDNPLNSLGELIPGEYAGEVQLNAPTRLRDLDGRKMHAETPAPKSVICVQDDSVLRVVAFAP